jgi:hypothetical protein
MPEPQAEILAEEQARMLGEQLPTSTTSLCCEPTWTDGRIS